MTLACMYFYMCIILLECVSDMYLELELLLEYVAKVLFGEAKAKI